MTIETVSTNRSFGGTQGVYRHVSRETGTPMVFSVFVPDHTPGAKLPVVWYLSGLTCTHANVTEKGEFRRACAELGLVFVAPDTSPRGDDVPDDEAYDFGKGAGFYVDAARTPWAANFRMRSYVESELPEVIGAHFPADMARQGIMGHSMGGHGALTISLRNPGRFRSNSAFARATITAIISSRRSWSRTCAGTMSGSSVRTDRPFRSAAPRGRRRGGRGSLRRRRIRGTPDSAGATR